LSFCRFHSSKHWYSEQHLITKTLITKKCTKRVLSSIVTHSCMFRPCWAIFRENFPLPLH
jgi:hypothetical protein